MNTKLRVIILIILLIGVAGCDRPNAKRAQDPLEPVSVQEQAPQKPASFQKETLFTSVTPTADGGAYAVGISGLWYLLGSEAIQVKFTDLSTNSDNGFRFMMEITPLLDGGAYAYSIVDRSFWHLRGGTATRVSEVPSLSVKPISAAVSAFPLYVSERQKRLEAEHKLEERPDPNVAPPE